MALATNSDETFPDQPTVISTGDSFPGAGALKPWDEDYPDTGEFSD
jgi:hypothetical protein